MIWGVPAVTRARLFTSREGCVMSLSRKIVLRNLALLGGLVLLSGVSLWGLLGLRGRVDDVLAAYQDMKAVETIMPLVLSAHAEVEAGKTTEAVATLRTGVREM